MKHFSALLLLLCLSFQLSAQQQTQHPNQLIVKFKTELNPHTMVLAKGITGNLAIDGINQKHHAVRVQQLYTGKKSHKLTYTVQFPLGTDLAQIIDEYNQTGAVEYAEPDFNGESGGVQSVVPNDFYFGRQWSLHNDGSFSLSPATAGADVDMENAWNIEQGDSNITVAIIDSGCKLDHPEFTGRIWTNYAEIANNGVDDDNNGFIDDRQGWDFANNDNDPTDDEGHGTNVTGIIGANGNNNIGYAGMDWNCKLMILKGIDNTSSGLYSWWSAALYYAVDNGARVISMSVGGSSLSSTLQTAVNYALNNNVTVVACIMNTNSNTVYYPAGFANVIAVGSTNADDTRSNPFFWSSTSGSNYGAHISVVAPGNYIYGLDYLSNTSYGTYWGGTSQATPHVSGLAALLLAQDPMRTNTQIKSIIEMTAEDQVGNANEDVQGFDIYFGHGRINAYLALSVLGMEDQTNAIDYSVYPNPSSGKLNIDLPANNLSTTTVSIYNSTGELVYTGELHAEKNSIDFTAAPGFYIMTLQQGDKVQSQKLIVE